MTTVQNMWDLAKDLADISGSFPVDARGIDYANTALRILHNALVTSREDYFLSIQTVSVVSGTETYALNADFQRALKVFYEPTSGDRRYPVDKFNLDDLRGYKRYAVDDGTVKLWYVPKPTVFTLVSSVLADVYPVGAEDFIAYHMATQLNIRQEKDNRDLANERDRILQSILDSVEPRDEEENEVVDVYGRWGGDRELFALAEQRDYRYRILGNNIHIIQTDWRAV